MNRHLKIVRNEPPKPVRRKRLRPHQGRILSADEQRKAKQALRNMAVAFGGLACLASALYCAESTLFHAIAPRGVVSAALLVRASLASGLSITELLGPPAPAERCRACGQIKRRAA